MSEPSKIETIATGVLLSAMVVGLIALMDWGIDIERRRKAELRAEGFKQGACFTWDQIAVGIDARETAESEAGEYCKSAGWVWSWDRPTPDGGETR